MLSCKEAAELMSKAKEKKLSFGERLSLKMRISICYMTKRYYNQISTMNRLLKRDCGCTKQNYAHPTEKCTEEFKDQLKAQLREENS